MKANVIVTAKFALGPPSGGSVAYIASINSPETVSALDTVTNTVKATTRVGNCPSDLAVSPDGRWVYTANSIDNTVSVIATASNRVIATGSHSSS